MRRLLIGFMALTFFHCAEDVNNNLPAAENKELERRVNDLEKEVVANQTGDQRREEGVRLTEQTLGETNSYLETLYKNINRTRPQDLPEWQEMYTAMTDETILEDQTYGLGPREVTTNFQRLSDASNDNQKDIEALDKNLAAANETNTQQGKALELILARLDTIDNNIKELNQTVDAKFRDVDKTLKDYEGRIDGVENRMRTLEIDVGAFRQEFVEYKQRVTNIENLLRRYDLATMHADIKDLKEIAANHDERLIDLLGRVQANAADISTNRNDLSDAEQELSSVSSDLGNVRVAVDEIFNRLDNCGCM